MRRPTELEPVSGRGSTMACHVRGTFPDCEHNKSSGAPFPWLCLLPRLTNVPQLKALCRHCGLKFQVARRVPLRSRNLRSGNHLSFISRKPDFRHSETSLMSFLALEKVNGFVKDSLVARFSTNDDVSLQSLRALSCLELSKRDLFIPTENILQQEENE